MNKDTQRLLKWAAVAVLLIGSFLFIIFSSGEDTSSNDTPEDIEIIVEEGDWAKGNLEAENILVEYSDFQCPACKSRVPIVEQLMGEFGNHIKMVYRHYPLPMHSNAQLAAQATEAAGLQGKFWEMHDLIFEGQAEWSNLSSSEAESTFSGYAAILELDLDQFSAALNSSEVEAAVSADASTGKGLGVNSTPTFYFNDQKVTNTGNYEQFRDFLREEIKGDS
jgi:protein-disulfide isomerase